MLVKNSAAREKLQNIVRESDFLYVKKLDKRPKIRFTHTFDFHGKKKRCPSQSQVIFSGSEISSIACFCMRYLYLRFSSMMGEHIFYLSGTTRCGARPKVESPMTQIDSQRSKINSKWPKIDFLGKKNQPYNPQTQFSVAQNGLRKIKIHFQRAKSAPSTYTHYTVYGAQYNNKILKCGILMFSCVCSNV